MTDQERQAILTLALMAARADDRDEVTEREALLHAAGTLGLPPQAISAPVDQASIDAAVAALDSADTRRLAYDLCVGVCDADGVKGDAERTFLDRLEARLGLQGADAQSSQALAVRADALAAAPLAVVVPDDPAAPAFAPSAMAPDEQDRIILHYAILNGALELLPDSLASMAIIPLQMKLVYRIGQSYGYELGRAHIKDFLLTAGAGMASQYVEQIGVRLIGGIFGRGLIGGLLGAAAKQAVSTGFSFAATYAIGHLAVRYYAGGRVLSADVLRDTYQSLLGDAKAVRHQHMDAIRERARTINVSQILQDVRA